MQTIARANRVTSFVINGVTKNNGEIVDYYNVFRNMKKALKDYAQGEGEGDEPPVQEKGELFRLLDDAIEEGLDFCAEKSIDLPGLLECEQVFAKIEKFKEFADILVSRDEWRKGFNVYSNTISSLYEACKPEILSQQSRPLVAVFIYLRGVIDGIIDQADIDEICRRIGELLDESVVVDGAEGFMTQEHNPEYKIVKKGRSWDLSKIDFEKLQNDFKETKYKNIEIANLRSFIEQKLEQMLAQNISRTDFAQKLQEIIDQYNAGGSSTENYFDDLQKFTEEMQAEDERHVKEGLSEDELELYDLLKRKKMTKDEKQKVKLAASSLLHRLLEEHPKVLVQDWYKDNQSQKIVRSAMEEVLDNNLPESYNRGLFTEKCNKVFNTIVEYASRGLKWAA